MPLITYQATLILLYFVQNCSAVFLIPRSRIGYLNNIFANPEFSAAGCYLSF